MGNQTRHGVATGVFDDVRHLRRTGDLRLVFHLQRRQSSEMVVVVVGRQKPLDLRDASLRFQSRREMVDETVWVGTDRCAGRISAVDEQPVSIAVVDDVGVRCRVGHLEDVVTELAKNGLKRLIRMPVEQLIQFAQSSVERLDRIVRVGEGFTVSWQDHIRPHPANGL